MKIAVLGTGMVGRTIAGALAGLGHDVVIGTRDPQATLARTEPDMMGTAPFAEAPAEPGDDPADGRDPFPQAQGPDARPR